MKKFIIFIFALVQCYTITNAQTFEWGLKSNSTPKWRYADVNKNGSCYFSGIVQYGLGMDTASFTGGSNYDAYVGMVNSTGSIQFLKKAIYDVAANENVINNIAADNNDNFFLIFNVPDNDVPIYVGDDTIQKDTATSRVLMAKYDENANLLWSKQYKPVNPTSNPTHEFLAANDERTPIAVDESGCVYVFVKFNGYVDAIIDTATLNWNGNYIFKFSPDGEMIYYKKITKLIPTVFNCDHQNNFLVAGTVTGSANPSLNTLDFGNNVVINFPTTTANHFEFVLVKYDSNGVAQWAKVTNSNYPTAAINNVPTTVTYMSIDNNNAIYLTGYFNTQIVFFDDTLNGVSTSYERNNFMTKFKVNGDYQWAKSYVDTSSNQDGAEIRQLKFDSDNNLYLFCHYIQKGFSFYGNAMPKNSSSGSSDRMLAKLDTNFNLLWWKYLVGGESNNVLTKMNVSDASDIYIVGGGTSNTKVATLVLQSGYWMPAEDSTAVGTINGTPYVCKFSQGSIVNVENSLYENMSNGIYPNPAQNKIYFTDAGEKIRCVEIFNINGQIIYKENTTDISNGIDISHFKTGVYFVKKYTEKKLSMHKFIKL